MKQQSNQETSLGLFYVALPDEVLKELKAISEKTGRTVVQCLSDAVHELKEKTK
jgi:predicted DNA-binding protein